MPQKINQNVFPKENQRVNPEPLDFEPIFGGERQLTEEKMNRMIRKGEIEPTGFLERARLSFGAPHEMRERIEPRGFLKGGLAEVPGDIADILGPSIREAGFIGGAALGTIGGGFLGGVGGATIGTGMGEWFRQEIGEKLGLQQVSEAEKQALINEEAILAGTTEAILGPLAIATRPFLRPAARVGRKVTKPVVEKTIKPTTKWVQKKVTRPAAKAATDIGSSIIEMTISARPGAQRMAVLRSKAAQFGYKNENTARIVYDDIRKIARNVEEATQKVYSEGIGEVTKGFKQLPKEVQKQKQFAFANDFKKLRNAWMRQLQSRRIKFKQNGTITGFPIAIDKSVQGKILTANKLIQNQRDFSPKGIRAFLEDLGAQTDLTIGVTAAGAEAKKRIPVVGTIYHRLTGDRITGKGGLVIKHYPELNDLNKTFSYKKRLTGYINDLFQTAADDPKRMQEGYNTLLGLYNENERLYIDTVIELEQLTGVDILGRMAGVQFQRWSPDVLRTSMAMGGITTGAIFGNPWFIITLPFFSPRAVGGVLTRSGLLRETVKQLPERVAPVAERGKEAVAPFIPTAARVGGLELLRERQGLREERRPQPLGGRAPLQFTPLR